MWLLADAAGRRGEMTMADLEPRVAVLEAAVTDIRVSLGRIEERLAATATGAQVEYLRGRVERLPAASIMLVGIIGGQVALAALIASVVFGVARAMGKL